MAHKDPARTKEYQKEWYEKNKNEIKVKHKQYYKDNKKVVSARIKKYRDNLGDEYKEKNNNRCGIYEQNNPEKRIHSRIKCRAKKLNLEFNLDIVDIQVPQYCPILNIPIVKIRGVRRGPKSNSPSIDRIDNLKGYIKGNIQVISNKANTMKNSASPKQLLQFAFWVILTYRHLIDKDS